LCGRRGPCRGDTRTPVPVSIVPTHISPPLLALVINRFYFSVPHSICLYLPFHHTRCVGPLSVVVFVCGSGVMVPCCQHLARSTRESFTLQASSKQRLASSCSTSPSLALHPNPCIYAMQSCTSTRLKHTLPVIVIHFHDTYKYVQCTTRQSIPLITTLVLLRPSIRPSTSFTHTY